MPASKEDDIDSLLSEFSLSSSNSSKNNSFAKGKATKSVQLKAKSKPKSKQDKLIYKAKEMEAQSATKNLVIKKSSPTGKKKLASSGSLGKKPKRKPVRSRRGKGSLLDDDSDSSEDSDFERQVQEAIAKAEAKKKKAAEDEKKRN